MSFEAVSKNRQRWSWGDVGWQTVPEAASGNRKCTISVDHQQWTAVYVGSLAARMTTTGDGNGWKRRRSGCSLKDTMAPGRAGIGRWAQLTWNRCVPETAASIGLAVWVAATEVDWAETQEVLRVLRCSSRDVAPHNQRHDQRMEHGSDTQRLRMRSCRNSETSGHRTRHMGPYRVDHPLLFSTKHLSCVDSLMDKRERCQVILRMALAAVHKYLMNFAVYVISYVT